MDTTNTEELRNTPKDTGFTFFLKNIHLLFFKPSLFFKNLDTLDFPLLFQVSFWLIGMSNVVERIDQKLMKFDLGTATSSNRMMQEAMSGGWLTFFLVVIGIGALGAFFVWLIGGWFYNLRLSWSGAGEFDRHKGRLVYALSGLVYVVPHLTLIMISTAFYPDYITYFNADEYWSSIIIIFPFWSVFVSYKGLRANFNVVKWKALIWFVILPSIFYLSAYGFVILSYINMA